MDSACLSDGGEDGYFLDDEEYDDGKSAREGPFCKEGEDFYEDEDKEDEPVKPKLLSRNRVVPMKQRAGMEASMVRPTSIGDAKGICDHLPVGRAVVLSIEGLHTEVAQRAIGFTSGATYSVDEDLQKISSHIFVAVPESMELSGDFQNLFGGGSLDVSGVNLRI